MSEDKEKAEKEREAKYAAWLEERKNMKTDDLIARLNREQSFRHDWTS